MGLQLDFFQDAPVVTPKALRKPRWYQEEAIAAIRNSLQDNRSTLCVLPTGMGKQQPVTEPVLTPSGWRKMGDLEVGDEVIGSSGLPVKVTGVFPQGVRPVFRIELQDGTFARCGDEHLWTVRTKYDKNQGAPFRTITTREIAARSHLQWQLPPLSPVQNDRAELALSPYALGVLMGDGSLSTNSISACTDIWIGERLGWVMKSAHLTCEYVAYFAPTKEERAAARRLGLAGKKSDEKLIPTEYMNASARQRLELLQGLMDTDGFPMETGGAEFSSTSQGLIDAVCQLARSLGGVARKPIKCASTFTYKGERRHGKPAWRVNIKLPAGMSPFLLPRKASKYVHPTKYHPTRIIRRVVDEGVSEEQVCIMVDAPDHLYVTRDHILTHNTFLFSSICKKWQGRVLVLAHRDELITQARDALIDATLEPVAIEKAEYRSSNERLIVASIQTMHRRLDLFPVDYFALIIVDEAHRTIASSYMKVLNHFAEAKVLGVTATPDRSDEKAMGKVFDDVAYVMDIEDGIDSGYLVPVRGKEVFVEEVDLSNVSTSAGDLAQGELDQEMLKATESVVRKTYELAGSEQVIIFTPGVASAHAMCDRMNEMAPGKAIAIDGQTEPGLRKRLVDGFKKGQYQFLMNCAVATEGFDAPSTSIVVMARPTKSRSLYAQCIGRATRVLPGTVDNIDGKDRGAERRAAIAASKKPYATILDFVGNSGRHSLVGPVDVLGGSYTEEEVKLAKKKVKDGEESPRQALQDARQELRRTAVAMAAAKVKARITEFDPFKTIGMRRDSEEYLSQRFGSQPMTEGQRNALKKFGMGERELGVMDKRSASKALNRLVDRAKKGLASLWQIEKLSKYMKVPDDVSFQSAMAAVEYIKRNPRPDMTRLQLLLSVKNVEPKDLF